MFVLKLFCLLALIKILVDRNQRSPVVLKEIIKNIFFVQLALTRQDDHQQTSEDSQSHCRTRTSDNF